MLDACERIAVLGERVGELVPDRADLEHHHADGVGDDVVEFARDSRALLCHRDPGGRVPLPLGLGRAYLRRLSLLGTLAHGKAREPADPEQERDEDELADRVRRLVVDHDRRAADRDGQARLCLQDGTLVPEQERGGHPDDEDAGHERDQVPVDEREPDGQQPERGRSGERKAPPREEREHQDRDRGHAEPRRRPRCVRQASPERYFEHGFERQQHDQHVERVPAGERPEALHVSNVLHALAHRLLPK